MNYKIILSFLLLISIQNYTVYGQATCDVDEIIVTRYGPEFFCDPGEITLIGKIKIPLFSTISNVQFTWRNINSNVEIPQINPITGINGFVVQEAGTYIVRVDYDIFGGICEFEQQVIVESGAANSANTYSVDELTPNAPKSRAGNGLVTTNGGSIIYVGTDGRLRVGWFNGSWNVNVINYSFPKVMQNSDMIWEDNRLFYVGEDGEFDQMFWANGQWNHQNMPGVNVKPNTGITYGNNRLFYVATNNKIYSYIKSFSGWNAAGILNGSAPKVANNSDLAYGYGGVYYVRRNTNVLSRIYLTNTNIWIFVGNVNSSLPKVKAASEMAFHNGRLYYFHKNTNQTVVYNASGAGGWTFGYLPGYGRTKGAPLIRFDDKLFYAKADNRVGRQIWITGSGWDDSFLHYCEATNVQNNSTMASFISGAEKRLYYIDNAGTLMVVTWNIGGKTATPIDELSDVIDTTPDKFTRINQQIKKPTPGFSDIKSYPNPFYNSISIEFNLNEPQKVSLAIFDISGRLAINLMANEHHNAGSHKEEFDLSNLNSGVYFYRLFTGTDAHTGKIIKQ